MALLKIKTLQKVTKEKTTMVSVPRGKSLKLLNPKKKNQDCLKIKKRKRRQRKLLEKILPQIVTNLEAPLVQTYWMNLATVILKA